MIRIIIVLILAAILLTAGCASATWHSERAQHCEQVRLLSAQTYDGPAESRRAMALVDWWTCMTSD